MPSVSRAPRATVSLAGAAIPCEDCSVGQTKKAHAGTFSAKIPLAKMTEFGRGLDWIASNSDVAVEVRYSIGDSASTVMFKGHLDKADIDAAGEGVHVSLSGRDASAKINRKKTNEKFINQSHEDIARTIAGRHGLSLDSDGGTVTAGRIYTAEQAKITDNQTEWTLLKKLAEFEGKVLAVNGDKLHFKKIDDDALPTYKVMFRPPDAHTVAQSSGLISIKLGRNFQAAKKIKVKVKSWDHKKKQLIESEASSGDGDEQLYEYHHHHRTQAQADHHAKGKLKEHARHEFDLTIDMPGDVTLTPYFQIAFSGTNSGFDQNYHIDHIDHKMGHDGYRMSISTKTAKKGRK
jgi:phage protein D